MKTRFAIFIFILTVVLGSASFYLAYRWSSKVFGMGPNRRWIMLCVVLFLALQISGPLVARLFHRPGALAYTYYWMAYVSLGAFACAFFYTVAADLLGLIWRGLLDGGRAVDLQRRSFLTAGIATLGSTFTGIVQAASGPKVYEVEVPLLNLPPEFDGFKIVQISDLHVGPTIGKRHVEQVARVANSLSPDLVALTGDFADGLVPQLEEAMRPLGEIRSAHGSFFVTGNHEYYWGADQWMDYHQKLGAKVLQNEHVLLERKGKQVALGGVPDLSAGQFFPDHVPNAKHAFKGVEKGICKILLAHQPGSYKDALAAGCDLQLSGHTHGGQFFPWSILVRLVHRFSQGLYEHQGMHIYVNRGTGYWGPPLRFTVPSEITLIKLRSKLS